MSMLDIVLIWANIHRVVITLLIALIFWGLAYGIYFRRNVMRYMRRGEAHSWHIDMTTKTPMRGNRVDANNGRKLM